MLIELRIEGGFGAFPAKSVKLDSAGLTPDLAAELQRRVDAALAEARQRGSARRAAIPDARRYRLIIHQGTQPLEITAADPAVPAAFASLMEFVKAHGGRASR